MSRPLLRAARRLTLPLALLVLALAGTAAAQTRPDSGAAPAPVQSSAMNPAPAAAPPPASLPAVSPAEAQRLLDMLKDDRKRAEFTATLEALAHAGAPAAGTPVAAAPGATASGAAPAAAAPPETAKENAPLLPDSLGAQVLLSVSNFLNDASDEALAALRTVRALPSLLNWVVTMATDPLAHDRLLDTLWRLAIVLGCGLGAEYVAARLVRAPIARLNTRAPGVPAQPDAAEDHRDDEDIDDHAEAEADDAPDAPPPAEGPPRDMAILGKGAAKGAARGAAQAGPAPARRRLPPSALALARRFPSVLGRFLLELLPPLAFALVAHLVIGSAVGGLYLTRLSLLALADAYAVTRVAMCVARMLVSPDAPRLRLVHMSDAGAAYAVRWLRRLVAVGVFGYAIAEVGLLFGLSHAGHEALVKAFALVDHVFLGVIVLQKRRTVKRWISPKTAGRAGAFAGFRRRLAAVWHWIALFYIAALWIVWAIEIPDGFSRLVRVFLATVIVLGLARIVLIGGRGAVERALHVGPGIAERYPGIDGRARFYLPVLHGLLYALVVALAGLGLLQAWGLGAYTWLLGNTLGHQLISAVIAIVLTVAVAVGVWEAANIAIARHLARLTREMQLARLARLRTLLPMVRSAVAIAGVIVVGLMVLSEIGVNIAPLLAGAGVIGIAIGFGSQKLVQDVITGLFLLLENAMQVGDVVSLGGLSGTVEYLSIRTIRLRSEDGSVHVIPFSAVTTVTNQTRDYSHAVIEVSVGYNDDYDRVVVVMQDIAARMRAEPRWAAEIRDELEVWGLNKFTDSGVVVKCRLKCGPFARWKVGREFNRRLKAAFAGAGIYIARQGFADDPTIQAPPPPPQAAPPEEVEAVAAGPAARALTPAR